MLFIRQDSSFGPSVYRIFFVFVPWGGVWDSFSLKGGPRRGGGGAYLKGKLIRAFYSTRICDESNCS